MGNWYSVGKLKQVIQYIFICKFCDCVFFDSDMIFGGNFKQDLINNINEDIDLQIMNEKMEPRKEVDIYNIGTYNIGFMVVQSSPSMLYLFKYWLNLCYNTTQNPWDQGIYNYIMYQCTVLRRDNIKKTIFFQHNFNTNNLYQFIVHFLCPVKYINYCDLISTRNVMNNFSKTNTDLLISYAKDMKLKTPNLVHFACIFGKIKQNFVLGMNLDNQSYEYYMNHLINFKFQ